MNPASSHRIPFALLLGATLAAHVAAQNLTRFQNGQVADANAVNANFDGVKNAVNQAQATADAAQAAASSLSASVGGLAGAFTVANDHIGIDRRLQFPVGTTNRKLVLFPFADNDHQFLGFGVNNNTLRYQVDDVTTNHVFYAAASESSSNELMRIQGDGKVGIGTANPTKALSIGNGTTPADILLNGPTGALLEVRDASNPAFPGWDVYMNSNTYGIVRSQFDYPFSISGTNGNVAVGLQQPGNTFKFEVAGSIRCTSLTQTSSRELKADIAPLTGAMATLRKLQAVSYTWNDKAPEQARGKRDIGFLADEMAAVLPEIVAVDEHGKALGIDYGKVTPVVVEAIKELEHENERLRAENDAMRGRLEALEQAVAQLQSSSLGKK